MYLHSPPPLNGKTLFHRKIVLRAGGGGLRVFVEAKPVAFSRLGDNDLLNTGDICLLFGCSMRTVYRWVAEGNVKPAVKVGRDYLFTKRAIMAWNNERPHVGRPLSTRISDR